MMRQEIAALKASGGPSQNTKSQPGNSSSTLETNNPIILRVTMKPSALSTEPDNTMTISDGLATMVTNGRYDDGCDDSMVSSDLAEKAVAAEIGRIQLIPEMEIIMPVEDKDSRYNIFRCERTWCIPRTVLTLSSGQLALCNISFLVVNGNIIKEKLLIGLPVLRHLRIDTRTLLEQHRSQLHETDCREVGNATTSDKIISMKRVITNKVEENRSYNPKLTVDYRQPKQHLDPFQNQNTFSSSEEKEDIQTQLKNLIHRAVQYGFLYEHKEQLNKLIHRNKNIFCIGLSPSPPARFPPLKIETQPDAKPIRVELRNYSNSQKNFLKTFVEDLIKYDMAYPNPTSKWASAPLIIPKDAELNKFRFTVDLRFVNKYTSKHQYPMPNLEHERSKLSKATCFANFDLSRAYWQLPLDPSSQECQTFVTLDGLYTPNRVLHGTTNAVAYLQSSLQSIM